MSVKKIVSKKIRHWQKDSQFFADFFSSDKVAQDSEFARVFDMPGLWIYLQFWISQGSENNRALNASVTQGSKYAWIIYENAWLYLDMPEYVWMCLNLRKPAFVLRFPISPFSLQSLFHFNTWLIIWTSRGYSLKEHEAAFLKKKIWAFQ